VLGHYVRETKALTWEDAVRKMTALPANTIGMVDRGFLAPGMMADVTVFDPKTVIDHATYDDPARPSDGIRYVLVNGVVALRDGKVTGDRGGRVLTRTAHMPSRPMSTSVARRLSLDGTVVPDPVTGGRGAVRVAIDATQAAGTARAKGSIRLSFADTSATVETTELGVLQTARDWASVTARIPAGATGRVRFVTVIVERADPFVAAHPTTVAVDVDDAGAVSGPLKPSRAVVLR
jgi:hypothetical protein